MQYKNIVAIAFGVFFLLPFNQASAQIWCDPLLGFCSDPYGALNQSIQQQQSQVQAQQQAWQRMQDKESALKSQYGYAAYSSCTANMLNIDGGNISQVTMFLNADESCMASYKTKQDAKTQCSAGYVYFNGSCVSGAQGCLNSWGANSVWTGTGCDCASGYQWGGSKCTATTPSASVSSPITPARILTYSGTGQVAPTCTADLISNGTSCSGGYCPSGYHRVSDSECDINVQTTATTQTKTSNSHVSGLAANQIAAILSLLQAFGADQSVIASVKAALGQ